MSVDVVRHIRTALVISLCLAGVLVLSGVALHASGLLALKETLVNGAPISEDEAASLGLRPGASLLYQDCELVAEVMCRRSGIGSARVELDFPNRVLISANDEPIEYVGIDERTREAKGITGDLRVTTYDEERAEESSPALTGLGALKLYEKPEDTRLPSVVEALRKIKEQSGDWFSEISAIDFSSPDFVTVSLNSYDFPAICLPATMDEALGSLFRLCAGGTLPVDAVELVDLRYDDVIVVRGGADASGGGSAIRSLKRGSAQ